MAAIINLFVLLVCVLFFIGLIGSAAVVVISFFEDMTELLGD
ncbi:MAG TPA: hypothetical protein VME86_06140 [Acidobacteriaceae bacterium]|nr:hypothetical protein [Acidobacteriaceae bacterium]